MDKISYQIQFARQYNRMKYTLVKFIVPTNTSFNIPPEYDKSYAWVYLMGDTLLVPFDFSDMFLVGVFLRKAVMHELRPTGVSKHVEFVLIDVRRP